MCVRPGGSTNVGKPEEGAGQIRVSSDTINKQTAQYVDTNSMMEKSQSSTTSVIFVSIAQETFYPNLAIPKSLRRKLASSSELFILGSLKHSQLGSSRTETCDFLVGNTSACIIRPFQKVLYRPKYYQHEICQLGMLIIGQTDTWEEIAVATSHSKHHFNWTAYD